VGPMTLSGWIGLRYIPLQSFKDSTVGLAVEMLD
jgi:hypothetical protein